MQNELYIAILAGLGGMLGWGFADFFAKKTIDEVGDIISLAWAHIFGTLILLIFILQQVIFNGRQVSLPNDLSTWSMLIFFGVLQGAVYFFVYKGFSKGQVSVLSPVFASFSGITSILSIVVFGEIISGHLILALITIFSGVLLINIDIKTFVSKRIIFTKVAGLKEIAIATILASLWTLFWGKFVSGQDWLLYALFMYGFMTLAILLLVKYQKINLLIGKSNLWKFFIFIGLCEIIAYLAISFGYSATSHISIIALLSGAFSLPVIILARIFLKEKVGLAQTIGSVIIILGTVFLSLF
ncbi:MAG: DMT family transporter [Patescibacteria group bacterium]